MELFGNKRKKHPFVSAIVVAAGRSTRMQGIDKMLVELCGQPVLWHTLQAFEASPLIDEVILVCPPESIPDYLALTDEWRLRRLRTIAGGGTTRQQSVQKGLLSCNPQAEYICIHDGARPLLTPEVLAAVLAKAQETGAATAAVPVKDTIKVAAADGSIDHTPDRTVLYSTQTPQIFESILYRQAMEAAIAAGKDYTDDCQLVEALGHKVWLAEGDYCNLKITTPEDLLTASALLMGEELFL